MSISINNPLESSYIFIALFLCALFASVRRRKEENSRFPVALTTELKGLAILFIIFSHIGYFLVDDHRFLFPLSIAAGVGVDLFLFLSGQGLTLSALRKNMSVIRQYKARLLKIFTPFWITLSAFFLLDFFVLKIAYPTDYVVRSFLGFFPSADIFHDFNSPLWYFTLIVFYYLIFPLVFSKKYPEISALAIFAVTRLFLEWSPAAFGNVLHLYEVHTIAFPLGMVFAARSEIIFKYLDPIKGLFGNKFLLAEISRYFAIAILLYAAGYTALNPNFDGSKLIVELTSLATMAAIIAIFLLKKLDFRLFYIFGVFSYEIYLFHWPLLLRYDFIYKYTPAWFATSAYLGLFIGLGWILSKISFKAKSRQAPVITREQT